MRIHGPDAGGNGAYIVENLVFVPGATSSVSNTEGERLAVGEEGVGYK